MATSPSKDADKPASDKVVRPALAANEAQSLQSSVIALADTSTQRIASGIYLSSVGTPEERRDRVRTRVVLASSLVSIATEPDPVDALADILTFATLTVDAQRAAAKDKPADSPDAALLVALEQNEADAWKLAERWLNEPTRVAFRERVLAWPGQRRSALDVAFVRISDFKRGGSKSLESADGMLDSLRVATQQLDQTRLLAERSLFLAQRMPFLLRWQAEVYTGSALATQEAQYTQAQLAQISATMDGISRTLSAVAEQVTREREATLDDLFSRIATERNASLDQVAQVLQQERKATLNEASAAISAQRAALLKDVLTVGESAERASTAWVWRALLIGAVLIVMFLIGLLGTLLLYRRLMPAQGRRPATTSPTGGSA